MLTITIPGDEFFDESKEEFITVGDVELRFEHSLASVSKWESFWEKVFISKTEKTSEETVWYIKAMCLTPNVSDETFARLSAKHIGMINAYIDAKMTATTFRDNTSKNTNEVITSEVIYYWMVGLNIPFECEHWHLNRLITLIRVCNVKNAPQKKLSRAEIADSVAQRKALNEARRAQLNSSG